MNRYELHKTIEEAREQGRLQGLEEAASRITQPGKIIGSPANLPGGKYLCRIEHRRVMFDQHEVRVTLVIGRKYYTANQVFSDEFWMRLTKDDVRAQLNRWLGEAFNAMWNEFKKDVVFEWPSDQNLYS